jgi:hypothetical protein
MNRFLQILGGTLLAVGLGTAIVCGILWIAGQAMDWLRASGFSLWHAFLITMGGYLLFVCVSGAAFIAWLEGRK